MENENKDKPVLNEEELKEVAGGFSSSGIPGTCKYLNIKKCYEVAVCKWENGVCVAKTGN